MSSILLDPTQTSTRLSEPRFPLLEEALDQWFDSLRCRNISITDALIQEKASSLATKLIEAAPQKEDKQIVGLRKFQASNGWLSNFKRRVGITGKNLHGEAAGVSKDVVAQGRKDLQQAILEYDPKDVFNCDELGLQYRMAPSKSLTKANENDKGVKKLKYRVSVLLCTNADGSEKMRPLVIGMVLMSALSKY